jgi:hypothetical protein
MNYREIKTKVDTWREVQMTIEGDNKSSEILETHCNRMGEGVTNCGSVIHSRLNENHPSSKRHGRAINGSDTD